MACCHLWNGDNVLFFSPQEMAKILNHPRVYSFLHVPIQSASDSVLADMKREYCADDFRHVVDFLKDKLVVFQLLYSEVVFRL